jgi:hypothetical protein
MRLKYKYFHIIFFDYYFKYLKYKQKYTLLKKQYGGVDKCADIKDDNKKLCETYVKNNKNCVDGADNCLTEKEIVDNIDKSDIQTLLKDINDKQKKIVDNIINKFCDGHTQCEPNIRKEIQKCFHNKDKYNTYTACITAPYIMKDKQQMIYNYTTINDCYTKHMKELNKTVLEECIISEDSQAFSNIMDGPKLNESDEDEPNKDNDYIYVDSDDNDKIQKTV